MNVFGFYTNQTYRVYPSKKLGEGNQGSVYRINQSDKCVKLYKNPTKELEHKICFMVENNPFAVTGTETVVEEALIWPIDALYEDSTRLKFKGFLMKLALDSADLSELTTGYTIKPDKLNEYNWLKNFDRIHSDSFKRRVMITYNLANVIWLLHQTKKYVLVDCKPENIKIKSNGFIQLIDLDSIQINDSLNQRLYFGKNLTEEFRPPESFNNGFVLGKSFIDTSWDVYVFAAISYKLLVGLPHWAGKLRDPSEYGHDDGSTEVRVKNRIFPLGSKKKKFDFIPPEHQNFELLNKKLKDLFERSLLGLIRPGMNEWISELNRFHASLDKTKLKIKYPLVKTVKTPAKHSTANHSSTQPYQRNQVYAQTHNTNQNRHYNYLFALTVLFSFLAAILRWDVVSDYMTNSEQKNLWVMLYAPISVFLPGYILLGASGRSITFLQSIVIIIFFLLLPPLFGTFNWMWEIAVYFLPLILVQVLFFFDDDYFGEDFILNGSILLVAYFLVRLFLFLLSIALTIPRYTGLLDLLVLFVIFYMMIMDKLSFSFFSFRKTKFSFNSYQLPLKSYYINLKNKLVLAHVAKISKWALLIVIVLGLALMLINSKQNFLPQFNNRFGANIKAEHLVGQYYGSIDIENGNKRTVYMQIYQSDTDSTKFMIRFLSGVFQSSEIQELYVDTDRQFIASEVLGEGTYYKNRSGKITLIANKQNPKVWQFEK